MRLVTGFAVLLLAALPALAQMPTPPERRAEPTEANVAYAPADPVNGQGHLLDFYRPANARGLLPLVIWTGGSAFLGDNGKNTARYLAPELLNAGFAVAGVSIRSSSQTRFPGQVHDIKAAIRFLRANAARFGIDPQRIAIMGDSSGGWTTAMAALTGDAPEMEGAVGTAGVSSAVQAAVALYPPTDFLGMDRQGLVKCIDGLARPAPGMCHDLAASPESMLVGCAIQSCPDAVRAADPARYVSAADPPLMILHGRADALVPFGQGEHLFKALTHNCNTAVLYTLPLAGHGPPWKFLEDDAVQAGASIESMTRTGCTLAPPRLEQPGWPAVIAFLRGSMGVPQP
jgi:acetyl esterase/lipase